MDIASGTSYVSDGFQCSDTFSRQGSQDTLQLAPSCSLWKSSLASLFFKFCSVFGIMIEGKKQHQLRVGRCRPMIRRLWQNCLVCLAIGVAALDTWKSVTRHRSRLSSLEFTAIGMAFHRVCFVAVALIICIRLRTFSRKCQKLMDAADTMSNEMSNQAKAWDNVVRQKIPRIAGLFIFSAVVTIIVGLIAVYLTFSRIAARAGLLGVPRCIGWTCPTLFPLFGQVPVWLSFLFYSLSLVVAFGMGTFPQLAMFMVLYPIGLWFDLFAKSITPQINGAKKDLHASTNCDGNTLQQKTALHLRLTEMVVEVNEAFSFICWLLYLTDLTGFIATASLTLRHRTSVIGGESDIDLLPVFVTSIFVSSFYAVLRTSFAVWVSEKAHSSLPYLYGLNLLVDSDEDKYLCRSFISRLQGSRIALTAGGFFYITREFVITIFGVLLTYILFVYQMQDQKEDMSQLPKIDEIKRVIADIIKSSDFPIARHSLDTNVSSTGNI